MDIHIYCTECYTSNGLSAKSCSNCGVVFGRDKKYRVCVSVKGERRTRVEDNLTLARQKEATLKADLEREDMDIKDSKKTLANFFNSSTEMPRRWGIAISPLPWRSCPFDGRDREARRKGRSLSPRCF